jgi:hypothetical protein
LNLQIVGPSVNWDFDVFALADLTTGSPLQFFSNSLFDCYDFGLLGINRNLRFAFFDMIEVVFAYYVVISFRILNPPFFTERLRPQPPVPQLMSCDVSGERRSLFLTKRGVEGDHATLGAACNAV